MTDQAPLTEAEVPKVKVLIIDDEEKFGRLVKKNLERAGHYEVRVETRGAHGLDTAQEFRPDLILLDMLMPDLRGPEVAWRLRSDKRLKRVPIVFLTAVVRKGQSNTSGALVGGGWPFRAQPCVAKPVKTKDLVEAIEKNLLRKKAFLRNPVCSRCQKKIQSVNDAWLELPEPPLAQEGARLAHYDCGYSDMLRFL